MSTECLSSETRPKRGRPHRPAWSKLELLQLKLVTNGRDPRNIDWTASAAMAILNPDKWLKGDKWRYSLRNLKNKLKHPVPSSSIRLKSQNGSPDIVINVQSGVDEPFSVPLDGQIMNSNDIQEVWSPVIPSQKKT